MSKINTQALAKVEVKKSSVHGKGLFAGEDIKQGALIGNLSGYATTKDTMHTLWMTEKKGFYVQCDFKYINHKCDPNVAYYDDLTVVALRRIKKGDELFHDYGWGYD